LGKTSWNISGGRNSPSSDSTGLKKGSGKTCGLEEFYRRGKKKPALEEIDKSHRVSEGNLERRNEGKPTTGKSGEHPSTFLFPRGEKEIKNPKGEGVLIRSPGGGGRRLSAGRPRARVASER